MTRHNVHALRAVATSVASLTTFLLTAGSSSAANTEPADAAIAATSGGSSPLAIGGLGLMGTGILLVVVSLIMRRRTTR